MFVLAAVKDAKLARIEEYGEDGHSVWTYAYEADHLVAIHLAHSNGRLKWARNFELRHDDLGLVEIIEVRADKPPHQTYLRRMKGESVATIGEAVVERLSVLIPKTVAALGLREPAYALMLAHDDEGNDIFPPHPAVGLVSTRVRWFAEKGTSKDGARWMIWNPADHEEYPGGFVDLEDAELEKLCGRLNALISSGNKWVAGRKLLDDLATALNTRDWAKILPVTEDFIVLPIGLEGARTRSTLKARVPPERFAAWKKAGWVP